MSIGWGNWDVRIYATEAWVSLASRFAAEYPVIVEQLEAALVDPVAAVRLQVAQNLQVISVAAPERMWTMGERIATQESNTEILASYLNCWMRRFSHSDPERSSKPVSQTHTAATPRPQTTAECARPSTRDPRRQTQPLAALLRTPFTMYVCKPNSSVKMVTMMDESPYFVNLKTIPRVLNNIP